MLSYDAEPVYRPQVEMVNPEQDIDHVKKVAVTSDADSVTLSFQTEIGDEVFRAKIPGVKRLGTSAGVLGAEVANSIIEGISQAREHEGDSSKHITATERALIASIPTLSSATDNTVTFTTTVSGGDTDNALVSGNTLATLFHKLCYWVNKLKNHVEDTAKHPSVASLTSGLANTYAPKVHTHTHSDITDFDSAVTALMQTEEAGLTVGKPTANNGWTVIRYPENYVVCTKTFDTASVAINQLITNTAYEYCCPNAVASTTFPVTFTDIPQMYLGVQHMDDVGLTMLQGVGVWAVAMNKGSKDRLPNIRLQCASSVSARKYRVCVRVEGYTA